MLSEECTHVDTTKCQRLPVEFFDTYRRYKIGTRTVLGWLIENGSCRCPRSSAVSVRDLQKFASTIRSKSIPMPGDILFQLRETIQARSRLSRFFKKCSKTDYNEDVNNAHEFFTSTLQQILSAFSYPCSRVQVATQTNSSQTQYETEKISLNRFKILELYSTTTYLTGTTQDKIPVNSAKPKGDDSPKRPMKRAYPCISNDSMGDAASLLLIAQDLHGLSETVCEAWIEAARGNITAVAAALLTSVAFSLFDDIECRIHHVLGSSNPDVLQQAFFNLKQQFTVSIKDSEYRIAEFETISALHQPWSLLSRLREGERAKLNQAPVDPATVSVNVNPGSHVQGDEMAFLTLIENVRTLIVSPVPPDPVIRLSTPLYAEIGYFCTRDDPEKVSLHCTFGLRLMLETFKSQLRQSRKLSQKPNYRLKSLQLAQQAVSSLEAVLEDPTMPCRCPQTLALALQSVQEDLRKFTQRIAFDLFIQTPWVACSHMLEIVDIMFFYGIRLVTYRHYVGSVLHIYNALRTLTEMQSIPLLDTLCDNLAKVIFPGCRPRRNFRSCYTRFMGGRLNVKMQNKKHKSAAHDGAWHMTIPKDMARTASGLGMRDAIDDPRFDYKKLSIFYYVKQKKYCIDDHVREQCHRCANDSALGSGKVHETSAIPRRACSHGSAPSYTSPRERLLNLKTAIMQDFSGPLPLALTNFCAVYLTCVRIITLISDRWHVESDSNKRCLCFADMLLSDADMRQLNKGKVVPARYRALWSICQEVIMEVLAMRNIQEFVFQVD